LPFNDIDLDVGPLFVYNDKQQAVEVGIVSWGKLKQFLVFFKIIRFN